MRHLSFSGVFPILKTPFNEKEEIVHDDVRNETEWLIANGVDGIGIALSSEIFKLSDIEKFDLAFIDGDHEEKSFMNDIEFCKILTHPPHYLVLDDTKEEVHPCCHIYHSDIKNSDTYDCYNFEDWKKFVGMSIIKCR